MSQAIETIKEEIPKDAKISDITYEGSEIIVYTKNKEFFIGSIDLIKRIVGKIKKRIEVRADPSIILGEEETKEIIRKVVPQEAGIKDIYFEPEFARVVIHAEKPGLVIGKSGETLMSIKERTFWTPYIYRAPVIDSDIIKSIRKMLHKEAGYRKKFLNALGEKIYQPGKEVEWIRVTALGAYREVGRSCSLLQTPQSKVLLDCGMSVSAVASKPYPYIDAPEFKIQELDAVVLSHAHMDHCLPPDASVTMSDGNKKTINDIKEGDKVLSMNFDTGKWEPATCTGKTSTKGHKTIKKINTPFRTIESSPNHRFFTIKDLKIEEVEAQDLEAGQLLPTTFSLSQDEYVATLVTDVEYDKRRQDKTTLPDKIDEDIASLIGYIQGDGHYRSSNSIRITDADISLLEFYRDIVYRTFNYRGPINHHSDPLKNAFVMEINNAKIIRFLETNFPKFLVKTTNRDAPKKIIESSAKINAAYVRGLMDAEGSVITNTRIVKFTSYSENLLNGTRQILCDLGINCNLDKKFHSIRLASHMSIRRFSEVVGFNCSAKRKKLENMSKVSPFEKDIVPVTSHDARRVMMDARLVGRVHNSPKIRDNLSLYDLQHRGNGYCTRKTAAKLAKLLDDRTEELKGLKSKFKNPKEIRQKLSISLSSLSEEMGLQRHIIEYRESGYVDNLHTMLCNVLEERLASTIEITQANADKIRKILGLSVSWEEITAIETSENPYEELIDMEVLPNRNFIADGIVVHNSGLVPFLYEYGYRGPLYCTRPTRDLSALLQLDYLQICQRENKKPLYTSKGVEEAIKHCIPLEYGEVSDITPDMRLTFDNAGHLLGSAVCHIHIGDGLYNVLYTGDIKYERTKLFEKASTDFTRAETIIIEGTYGANEDVSPPHKEGERLLVEAAKRALARGGRVLIPSFAVGRSQDVIHCLTDSDIDVPIYLDGMLWDATAIHTAYPEFMAQNVQTAILHKGNNPFTDPRLKGIGSQKERLEVFHSTHPCIVLSTSGMLMGGPAIEYLKNFSEEPKNMLLFVGYQAEGTPGRRIQKGWKQIQLENGHMLNLELEIETVRGLSGHSDQRQLLAYLAHMKNKPRKVIINHCENTKCVEFARTVHKTLRIESIAPKNLETVRLR